MNRFKCICYRIQSYTTLVPARAKGSVRGARIDRGWHHVPDDETLDGLVLGDGLSGRSASANARGQRGSEDATVSTTKHVPQIRLRQGLHEQAEP